MNTINQKNISVRYTAFKGLLCLSLMLWTLGACQQERLSEETDKATVVGEGPSLTVHLMTSEQTPEGVSPNEARAVDFVMLQETNASGTTVVNPKLDPAQFRKEEGVDVQLVFVSTDASQPVSVVPTTLFPVAIADDGEVVPAAQLKGNKHYLRTTPFGGNQVTLAAGTDFTKGTWRMAIIFGGTQQNWSDGGNRAIELDPNNIAALGDLAKADEDNGLALRYDAGRSNLELRPAVTRKDSYTDAEKVSMEIPFFSEWKDITPYRIQDGLSTTWKIDGGLFNIYPQGTLFRVNLANDNFSDIKAAGIRVLTNSFSFRGSYNLSDANLRALSAGTKELSQLWTGRSAMHGGALRDSVDRTWAFPEAADFFFSKDQTETLGAGQSSSNYFLVWAMPKPKTSDPKTSASGIMHFLIYDKNRQGEEYNRSIAEGAPLTPIGLIRKPAATRVFGEGTFKLSSQEQAGQFFRVDAVQTKIYNFLDFVSNEDAMASYYTASEAAGLTAPSGSYVPSTVDWATIFPAKLSDVAYRIGGRDERHYFGSNSWFRFFNTSFFGQYGSERIGRGSGESVLVLENTDTGYTPWAPTAADLAKVGKSHNVHMARIPAAMQVPQMRGGRRVNNSAIELPLTFSTYQWTNSQNSFLINGWGQGQTYLTGIVYLNNNDGRLDIRARYLGPSFHRPMSGGNWVTHWPWDISFYFWNIDAGNQNGMLNANRTEPEDTGRVWTAKGFTVGTATEPDKNASSANGADGNLTFWTKDGNWFYYYTKAVKGYMKRGIGKPSDIDDKEYTAADNVKAPVLFFLDSPSAQRR